MTDESNAIQISDKIAWMFSTPIIALNWQDHEILNESLESLILRKEKEEGSAAKTNAGGWQSDHDLLAWGHECTNELKRRIDSMLLAVLKETVIDQGAIKESRFRLDCWANVNRSGDYNVVHSHPNSLWSGVYYVTKGNPNENVPYAGCIEFIDPREASSHIQTQRTKLDQRCIINNEPGMMLMFPSWLKHMVHPHRGTEPRISVAFNAMPVI